MEWPYTHKPCTFQKCPQALKHGDWVHERLLQEQNRVMLLRSGVIPQKNTANERMLQLNAHCMHTSCTAQTSGVVCETFESPYRQLALR
jgi:hypothetical protein